MKKILTTLAIIVTLTLQVVAAEEKIDQKVITAFNKEFNGAQEAAWEVNSNFYQVTFLYNGEMIVAYYNTNAKLLCVTRNLLSTDLPAYLQNEFRKKYAGYWITDLYEVTNDNGVSYYITFENADYRITLESDDRSSWEIFRTSGKI